MPRNFPHTYSLGSQVTHDILNEVESDLTGAWSTAEAANTIAVRADGRVKDVVTFGAVSGDNDTNAAGNASALAAANAAAQAVGGTVYFRGSSSTVYRTNATFTIYPNVRYIADPGVILKLANSANIDLVKTENFDTLNAGSTNAGPSRFTLENLILDGNCLNQTSGWVLSTYGSNFFVHNVQIRHGKSGGWRSKWGTGGTNMEAKIAHCKIYNCKGNLLDWQGPHDSVFTDVHIFTDDQSEGHAGAQMPGVYNVKTHGNAAGEQFIGCHTWGLAEYGWKFETIAFATNCQAEGSRVNMWFDCDYGEFSGHIFGTSGLRPWAVAQGGPGEVGVQFGTNPTPTQWGNKVDIISEGWATGDQPILYAGDGGNEVRMRLVAGALSSHFNPANGNASIYSRINVQCLDNPGLSQAPAFYGTGAPPSQLGIVGSFYNRLDGTTGTRQYHKTGVSTWTAIL